MLTFLGLRKGPPEWDPSPQRGGDGRVLFLHKKRRGSSTLSAASSTPDEDEVKLFGVTVKHKSVIFGTLSMVIFTMISALGDPWGNHLDRIHVAFEKAIFLFLPGVLWFMCLLITFSTSLFCIWHMLGYKRFLLAGLSSGLIYGLVSCLEKAYCYNVKIGPHLHMNGVAFMICYVVVASTVAGTLLYIILRKKATDNHSRGTQRVGGERRFCGELNGGGSSDIAFGSTPRVGGERRFCGELNGGGPSDIALGALVTDLESGFHVL